ncbi:hypothetical protein J6590_000780 [Homalodisca vitripennis]|nr:hypothetical protein J6590_000780 [Homalodisca vitripennis]
MDKCGADSKHIMDHEDTEKGKALPSGGESVQDPQTSSDKSVADALIPQNSRAMICSSTIIWKEMSTLKVKRVMGPSSEVYEHSV